MEVDALRSLLLEIEKLHSRFESEFSRLYDENNVESLEERLRSLRELSLKKLEKASSLYRELAKFGGRLEELSKELYKNEHQMKFRIEEVISHMRREEDFSGRVKLKASLDRLIQFHRLYDYAVRKAMGELSGEVEGLAFLGENHKKVPVGIMEEIYKTRLMEERLETLVRFIYRLYTHPSDVHRVERALMEWHSKGLLWVEARNVEKLSGVRDAEEILEGLTLIGVVEKKMRGGEGVYKHRAYG
ncbi:hypothetical protein [Thermococcus sp.]|uniref:hypothetical protein n=1 Tax=Thermococcus sp. TaxID=35749 RepID=UPI0025F7A26B|nr:hypothetical protein [Thermococcus sp.]